MSKKSFVFGFTVLFCMVGGFAWAGMAVPVSPGELTQENCPTFSWSAAENAAAYRVEVYEQVAPEIAIRERLHLTAQPIISKEIAAPALSWTPASGECLSRGINYIWYVQGVNTDREGLWSEGKVFSVDPAVLTTEQKDAVETVLKEYLSGDSISTATASKTYSSTEGSKSASAISPMTVVEGVSNTFVGTNAGLNTANQNSDTFIGADAGKSNTSGWANTFVGYQAGKDNITAQNNTFVGQVAGWKNTGYDNTFMGNGAGQFNTTAVSNTFIGSGAGTASLANPVTGGYNSFLGFEAGHSNTAGNYNSFLGYQAGYSNTTGSLNVFIGVTAGAGNTLGEANVFVGQAAGGANTEGSDNVFLGKNAGSSNTLGWNNTYIGFQAGNSSTGNGNVFVGTGAGFNSTGNGNVFIGTGAGSSETDSSNKLYIDNCYTGGFCTQPLVTGDFALRTVQVDGSLTMVTVATPSDVRYKKDILPLESSLDKVLHLQGVSYHWDKKKVKGAGYESGSQVGLIAQDVEKILPELVHTDAKGYKTLSYDKLAPVLIEAVKEQQRKINEKEAHYEASLKEKDARIERLERAIEKMEKRMASLENPARTVASNEQ